MKKNQSVRSSSNLSVPGESCDGSKKKILLVDDVNLFIELEKTFLQRRDAFEILVAKSGEEALKLVEVERPDLVYMDLHMPGMDGDECCRRIKASENGKNIPIVMVTSAGGSDDKSRCIAAGCNEIITKPINRSLFLSFAKRYLDVHERKEPRYASHIKIKFGPQKDQLLSDYTVNINTHGLFVSSPRLLPAGTELFVEFSLPGVDKDISCQARVAWINEGVPPLKRDLPVGMGLGFVGISLEEMNLIREYITDNGLSADW
jgi:CheY-like chemotaxis protein